MFDVYYAIRSLELLLTVLYLLGVGMYVYGRRASSCDPFSFPIFFSFLLVSIDVKIELYDKVYVNGGKIGSNVLIGSRPVNLIKSYARD